MAREQNNNDRSENTLREARAALEANIFDLKKENESLKNENQFLNHAKIDNESMIKELSQRVDSLDRLNIANTNELNDLRNTVQKLTKDKHSTELKLAEAVVSVESQTKQLREKDNLISETQKLVEHKEAENNTLLERLKDCQGDKTKLDDKVNNSITEINKGNDIISKLQKEVLSGKSKADKY